ncbi:MAG: MBL fold metallo-hydrolase RNA specificity domain-containing protein [Phycisphaerae bacterium]
MLTWDDGLRITGTDIYLDSRRGRARSFISHGHTDHLGPHDLAWCTRETAELFERRITVGRCHHLAYREPLDLDADTRLTLYPAGHVLGSAMALVERHEGRLLYTGDYKLRTSLTSPTAELPEADVLVMESTFGRPDFRFPPWRTIADELVTLCEQALRDGRQPIVYGYALGKAQEAVRILTDAGLPVTEHGAVRLLSDTYERLGVPLGPRRAYAAGDFHGAKQLDVRERGVLVAPPQSARAAFTARFEKPVRIMLSGWAMMSGAVYRYGVDHCLPISDHADFDDLLRTIDIVRPKRVYPTHGFKGFVDELRKRGIDARPAKPEAQLELF